MIKKLLSILGFKERVVSKPKHHTFTPTIPITSKPGILIDNKDELGKYLYLTRGGPNRVAYYRGIVKEGDDPKSFAKLMEKGGLKVYVLAKKLGDKFIINDNGTFTIVPEE